MTGYRFERQGRSPRTALIVALVLGGLVVLRMQFGAALWLLGLGALATLPALWDLWRNPRAGLALDDSALRWWTGRAEGHVPRRDIDHMRLDTSWDFSLRISVVLTSGRRVRLPYECTPPRAEIDAALGRAGVTIERHHFSLR
ncbi:MAG: hypothetical protein OIF47_02805 [Marinibacterium sp.]|nr:hypothetical protein [Marinibacterium sp.]